MGRSPAKRTFGGLTHGGEVDAGGSFPGLEVKKMQISICLSASGRKCESSLSAYFFSGSVSILSMLTL